MPPDEIRVVKVEPRTEPPVVYDISSFFFFFFSSSWACWLFDLVSLLYRFYEDAKILFVMYTCMILIIC